MNRSTESVREPNEDGTVRPRALEGIRVLDIGTMIAGPVAATLLADFGAEVIKIEKPHGGDTTRTVGPYVAGESLWWQVEGRNKKSLTLDLRRPEGQELFCRLVEKADVVVENFRPGIVDRWNIGYSRLKTLNPKLVFCSVSGFGQTGPYRERAGYDRIGLGFGGLLHISGYPDRAPVRPGTAVADYQSALFAAFGIIVALYARDRSVTGGLGQHIDLALYETVFRFTDVMVPAYQRLGVRRERQGNLHYAAAPGDHFRMRDGRYLVLTCSGDGVFRRICEAMDAEDIAHDERFATHDDRWRNITELNDLVGTWIAAHEPEFVLERLERAGAPFTIAMTIADIFEDPHYRARETIAEVAHPKIGPIKMPAALPRMSLTPGEVKSAAPALGEHTADILTGLLGLTSDELTRLRATNII